MKHEISCELANRSNIKLFDPLRSHPHPPAQQVDPTTHRILPFFFLKSLIIARLFHGLQPLPYISCTSTPPQTPGHATWSSSPNFLPGSGQKKLKKP
jgi:hypothetical protein